MNTETLTHVVFIPARRALFSLEPTAYTLLPYFVLFAMITKIITISTNTKVMYGMENEPSASLPVPNFMRRNS